MFEETLQILVLIVESTLGPLAKTSLKPHRTSNSFDIEPQLAKSTATTRTTTPPK